MTSSCNWVINGRTIKIKYRVSRDGIDLATIDRGYIAKRGFFPNADEFTVLGNMKEIYPTLTEIPLAAWNSRDWTARYI